MYLLNRVLKDKEKLHKNIKMEMLDKKGRVGRKKDDEFAKGVESEDEDDEMMPLKTPQKVAMYTTPPKTVDRLGAESQETSANGESRSTLGIVIGIVCVTFSSYFAASVIFPFAPFMVHSFYPNKTNEELGYFVAFFKIIIIIITIKKKKKKITKFFLN
ncbi:hypothetical protein RFI_18367, partial [Reticulomyxa filosa]